LWRSHALPQSRLSTPQQLRRAFDGQPQTENVQLAHAQQRLGGGGRGSGDGGGGRLLGSFVAGVDGCDELALLGSDRGLVRGRRGRLLVILVEVLLLFLLFRFVFFGFILVLLKIALVLV
jgi:hypothetical protein